MGESVVFIDIFFSDILEKSRTLGLLLGFPLVTNNCKCSEKISREQNQKAEATHGHLQ